MCPWCLYSISLSTHSAIYFPFVELLIAGCVGLSLGIVLRWNPVRYIPGQQLTRVKSHVI